MTQHKKKIFLICGLPVLLIILLFVILGYDKWIPIYEDFYSSSPKSRTPIILDIPVGSLAGSHEEIFKMPLRRDYVLDARLIVENGLTIYDPNTRLSGHIKILSKKGDIIRDVVIPKDYPINHNEVPLIVMSYKDIGGTRKPARLLITDLALEMSEDLRLGNLDNINISKFLEDKTLESLSVRFVLKSRAAFFE